MARPWYRRILSGPEPRTSGDPRSSNGASSFHLRWSLDVPDLRRAEVTLTVEEPPTVERLYFWALQADFAQGGGAHLGLQWHPAYPGSSAVNWGGYHAGGGELEGTTSALPSTLGNLNTRDFRWRAGVDHRLVIEPTPDRPGWWRGSVDGVVVRDLHGGGTSLAGLVMWSEVFARCDHPSVTIRWSDPIAVDGNGTVHRPESMRLSYQGHTDGGCANTDSWASTDGWHQRTNTERRHGPGAVV